METLMQSILVSEEGRSLESLEAQLPLLEEFIPWGD